MVIRKLFETNSGQYVYDPDKRLFRSHDESGQPLSLKHFRGVYLGTVFQTSKIQAQADARQIDVDYLTCKDLIRSIEQGVLPSYFNLDFVVGNRAIILEDPDMDIEQLKRGVISMGDGEIKLDISLLDRLD